MAGGFVGRVLVIISLALMLVLTILLSITTLGTSSTVSALGRPLVMALACLLVWQGHLWARWVVLLTGLGTLLAGPIALGNGMPVLSLLGLVWWLVSALSAASLWVLFFSPTAKSFLNTMAAKAGG